MSYPTSAKFARKLSDGGLSANIIPSSNFGISIVSDGSWLRLFFKFGRRFKDTFFVKKNIECGGFCGGSGFGHREFPLKKDCRQQTVDRKFFLQSLVYSLLSLTNFQFNLDGNQTFLNIQKKKR